MTTGTTHTAWTLAALAGLMTAAGLVLIGLAGRHPQGQTEVDFWIAVAVTGIVIPWSVVGALVAARRPGNPIGWMFLLAAVGISVSLAANAYAGYSEVVGANWPGAQWAAWLNTWLFTVSGIGVLPSMHVQLPSVSNDSFVYLPFETVSPVSVASDANC